MNSHVSVEISGLGKSEVAELALVRLLARMDSKMFRQGARIRECFLAKMASESKPVFTIANKLLL